METVLNYTPKKIKKDGENRRFDTPMQKQSTKQFIRIRL